MHTSAAVSADGGCSQRAHRPRCRGRRPQWLRQQLLHAARPRPNQKLGPDHLDRLNTARIQRHYVHRLEQLGYADILTLAGAAWAAIHWIFGGSSHAAVRQRCGWKWGLLPLGASVWRSVSRSVPHR